MQIRSDGLFTTWVGHLLGMCRPDSLFAQQVCDVFVEIEEEWHRNIQEANAASSTGYDYEQAALDATQTALKSTLVAINAMRATWLVAKEGNEMRAQMRNLMDQRAEQLWVVREVVNVAKELLKQVQEMRPSATRLKTSK